MTTIITVARMMLTNQIAKSRFRMIIAILLLRTRVAMRIKAIWMISMK